MLFASQKFSQYIKVNLRRFINNSSCSFRSLKQYIMNALPHYKILFRQSLFKYSTSNVKNVLSSRRKYEVSRHCASFPVHLNTNRLQKYINNVAVIDENKDYSYNDIYSKSLTLQQSLTDRLKNKGTCCVSHLLPNDASHVISQWATWNAGHIVVPLHPPHPAAQLKYYIDDSKSKVVITNEELASKFSSLLSDYEVIVLEKDFLLRKEEKIHANARFNINERLTSEKEIFNLKDSPGLILYTSGTTGPPKGVVLTHGNLHFQLDCLHKAWKWTSKDVILHCLPLHHVHGLVYALLCPIACGATVKMEPKFNASSLWSKLLNLNADVSSRVNLFMAVPTIYVKLIEEYEQNLSKNFQRKEYVKQICMDNIRLMISGSAALPVPILEKWREITGHTILERYGSTEIGMALSNPLQGERRPGFVGHPLPGVHVKIARLSPKKDSYVTLCDGNDKETTVTPGFEEESGDLLIKGPNVFREYWEKPEATKKDFTEDGWFCTGDTSAYINGSYKILGRTSVDIIKSGGFKISALDVERVLLTHPEIADVAVVGVEDMTWGEKVAALIVWKREAQMTETELRSWCKERLPHYQAPSIFKFFSSLPKNAVGKVNKKELVKSVFQIK